jgi:hypothetical protein
VNGSRARAALAIAGWIESTRGAGGYGGPVAHWWRDCLVDCRSGHDWRYEGIVAGYLALHGSGDERWLDRARQAGDDLVEAQAPDGHLSRSQFELNPGTGGTPHEAAATIGLLRLARALGSSDPPASDRYLTAGRTCVDAQVRDHRARPSFVPNKSCTLIEALLLAAELTGDGRYLDEYAVPTAREVLRHQVHAGRLTGAIAQNSYDRRIVPKYFPYYVARCVPGLLALHRATGDDQLADAALAAGRFVLRSRRPDGGFPQVLYEDGRVNEHPRWVAGAGDVLRALRALGPLGLEADLGPTEAWLLSGIPAFGGPMTARGFAAQGSDGVPDGPPELRDLLPVVGWADKALRYLAEASTPDELEAAASDEPVPTPFEGKCAFRGRRLWLRLDRSGIELRQRGRIIYRWAAGAAWADPVEPWMATR